MERTQIRIVAGRLRGRKLTCNVHEGMRPTPQMVREALFSILGNAVPDRAFYDVFAGTGVNGLEAVSRGASRAIFIERDFGLADAITDHLKRFSVADRGQVLRADVYRWAERWVAPPEPVNLFLSPPFADLTKRLEEFSALVAGVWARAADGSVLVVQTETDFPASALPAAEWDVRTYGRNVLWIAVKGDTPDDTDAVPPEGGG